MTVYYPSGKKTAFIPSETHKQICKAIHRGQNVERCIIHILKKTSPKDVVSAASEILSLECKTICKRGSGSILQDRSYDGILSFSWDKLHEEIAIRAPHTLHIISSMICDIRPPREHGKFLHVMHSIATVLHSRSQEMSALHYQVGFILAHGGCTQRVSTNVST